ncbi:MAG: hypothetical protein MJE77_01180 [Proteobacteria bacterium]|nr:hypothetical protein [Pseudomonadota bacterium]
MRYLSYSADDYIEKNDAKIFRDEFDLKPNCQSYLTYYEGTAIGSIRSCTYQPGKEYDIPVFDVFINEIKDSIGLADTIIEANKFVVDPAFRKRGGAQARFSIYKNITDSIDDNDAKYLVAGVRAEHVKFYRLLNFEQASEERAYPHVNFKTVLMICKDVQAFKNFIDQNSAFKKHQLTRQRRSGRGA